MNRFIDENKNNWQRLEELLSMLRGTRLSRLTRAEVREFGELYRRAAADLAIARAETRDPKLINYLNSLVIRAHGKIYRAGGDGSNVLWKFVAEDFPRAVRKNWIYVLIAFLTDLVFAAIAFALVYNDLEFAEALGLENIRLAAQTNHQWWLSLNEANQVGSSFILANNILVSFRAFALGALFGVGTLYVLAFNGLNFGGVLGITYKVDPAFGNELVSFVIGHGVVEMACIYLAGAAGMMIGYAIIDPGDMTRSAALKKKGMESARIVVGCAVLLVFAGIIEGFLSPAPLPKAIKYATGISTGLAMFAYIYLAGRRSPEEAEPDELTS